MATAKQLKINQKLSEDLGAWALKYDLQTDPYVKGLIKGLTERKHLPMWASLSPFEFLPLPNISVPRKKFYDLLVLLRNILIFVPVALTWQAVSQATTAFEKYISANPNSVVNFLEFWQNGKGYLTERWKIGSVAKLDFILISIIILMIFILHFQKRAIDSTRLKLESLANTERLEIGLSLHEYLFTKREVSDLTLKDDLIEIIEDLKKTSNYNLKSTKELNDSTKKIATNKDIASALREFKKTSTGKK